jgi:topoisomerase-4 subunit A
VRDEVMKGMAKYKKLFVRPMVDDDVKRLLEVRIRRISAYDIEKNRKDIDDIVVEIKKIDAKLKNMKKTTIGYINGLIDKYGAQYPRRTEITKIKAVDKKKVARQNIKLAYDKDSGFFGSDVRGDLFKLTVSEFDMVLGISNDGTYRVMPPPEKTLFTGKLIYCAAFDPDEGQAFTIVYRDKSRMCFAKMIKIHKFIRNKEYKLIGGAGGKIDLLLWNGETGELKLDFVPAKRQRVKTASFDLSPLEPTGTGSRGTRVAPKPVAKLKFEAAKAKPARKSVRKPARKPPVTQGGVDKAAPEVDDDGQGKLL